MRQCATCRRPSRATVRAALGLWVLAAGVLALSRPAVAASQWLPPDFGGNVPGVVVAIGDSITVGIFRDDCHNPDCIVDRPYPAILQSLLQARHPGVVVRNRGLGGESTGGGLSRLPGILANDRPGFVLIMEGTNDASGGKDPRHIADNLRAMVRVVKANSSIPLLGAIPPNFRDDPDAQSIVAEVNAMLPGVAAEEGVRFVDIFGPLNDPGLYGSEDRLHPSQRGYEVLAAAWRPALENAIDDSRSLLEGLTLAMSFDADGDGRADVAIFRTDTGEWFARQSSDAGLLQAAWGAPLLGDRPVPGHYSGDLRSDIAVYRPVSGEWFIRKAVDGSLMYQPWGAPTLGDVPVPADYDGDGKTDIAVYRRTTGEWFIHRSSDSALLHVAWGCPSCGDRPVPGAYSGGPAEIAVYRTTSGEWFVRRASDGALVYVPWGAPSLGDLAVPGNYTEAGPGARTDVAVFRLTTGEWFVRRSSDHTVDLIPWGAPSLGDVPVTGPPASR